MKVKSRTILKAVIIGLFALIICTTYIMKSVGYAMVDNMVHYSTGIEESKKNEALNRLVNQVNRLFDLLFAAWPAMRSSLKELNLRNYLENEDDSSELDSEPETRGFADTSRMAQEMAPESLNTKVTETDTSKSQGGYRETASLGQNLTRKDSVIGLVANLVKSFSEQVPNIQ